MSGALPIILAAFLSACTGWHTSTEPPERVISARNPKAVRVTVARDSMIYLRAPAIVGDSLAGTVYKGKYREGSALAIPLEEVRRLETLEKDPIRTVLLVAVILTAVVLIFSGPSPASGLGLTFQW